MAHLIACDLPSCDRETPSGSPVEAVGWITVVRVDGGPGRYDYDPGPWHFCGREHLSVYIEKFAKP